MTFYKEIEVEISEWDMHDYLDDLSDETLKAWGYVRTRDPDGVSSTNTKKLEEISKIVNELKNLVKFTPYSHKAVLFERLVKALEQ